MIPEKAADDKAHFTAEIAHACAEIIPTTGPAYRTLRGPMDDSGGSSKVVR